MTKRDRQASEYATESYEKSDEIRTNSTTIRGTTPAVGSVQGEGSVPDSRNAKEPVAWAVAGDYGEYAVKLCFDEASAVLEADRRCRVGLRPDYVVVPLYRHPQPTLTRDERDAVEWITKTLRLTIGPDRLVTLRGLVERLK